MSDVEEEAVWAALERAAEELRERAATVHERVVCPKCRMPVGIECRRIRRGLPLTTDPPLKHAHRERLTADGIALR